LTHRFLKCTTTCDVGAETNKPNQTTEFFIYLQGKTWRVNSAYRPGTGTQFTVSKNTTSFLRTNLSLYFDITQEEKERIWVLPKTETNLLFSRLTRDTATALDLCVKIVKKIKGL